MTTSFASDNYASALPEIIESLTAANTGHMTPYGNDPVTQDAIERIQNCLNTKAPAYFVYNGTAANVLALKVMVQDFQSIIAPDTAHIVTHEVAAPAHLTSSKILTAPNQQGKITPEAIRKLHTAETYWGRHATEPKVVSISQPTEFGTVYTLEELAAIRSTCDELDMYLHMDGCRIYNAAAFLERTLSDITQYADIVCLGGAKAGLMFGEALVFINEDLADNFDRRQKLGLQLLSKIRYVSAQFQALFTNELGMNAAAHANTLAQQLWKGLEETGRVTAAPTIIMNNPNMEIRTNHLEKVSALLGKKRK